MTGHDDRSKAGIITRNRENEAGDIGALRFDGALIALIMATHRKCPEEDSNLRHQV